MRLTKNKVFIRITKESRDSIFSKEITRDDGSKVKLWTNVEAMDNDDRRATLFVQTGIVEAVADNLTDIKVGDTAIIDYKLCNMDDHVVYKDGEDIVYWLEAKTTYHEDDLIAYASRKGNRDQIAYLKGDYDTLSMLLGVVSHGRVYAREPYVFLEHQSNVISKVSPAGILYSETQSNYHRKVLASSPESHKNYGISPGNDVLVHDMDIFMVKLEDQQFDCICDVDGFAYI
jgi:hypothetical protein